MTPGFTRNQHTWAVVGMLVLTAMWGGSFPAMKVVLQAQMSVGAMLALRFTLGAAVLGVFLAALRVRFTRQAVRDGLVMGLVLSIIFWSQADGLRYTTTAKSGFITSLYVVFTPLVGLAWKLRPKISHAIGVVVATLGLLLLVHDPHQPFGGWNWGDSETLVSAAACGVHIVMTGVYGQRSSGWVLAFLQVVVVALVSWMLAAVLPAAPLANGTTLGGFGNLSHQLQQPIVVISLVFQGLMATALAFYLMTTWQQYLGATEAAIVYSMEPVFTALLATSGLVPGVVEHLSPLQWLGGGVILSAMLVAELGPRWWGKPTPAAP